MLNNTYNKLYKNKKLNFIVIDGLDGSGKGTITDLLANKCIKYGNNVLKVDYPQYTTKWGKILKYLLKVNDMNLNLEERMAVYSINRLESIDSIFLSVNSFKNIDNDLTIIFDRFPTSNVLTISYYLAKSINNKDLDTKILDKLPVNKYLKLMNSLDKYFYNFFKLKNAKIVIPQINPRITIDRIQRDNTREGSDSYENINVQTIADYIYKELSNIPNSNIYIVNQEEKPPQIVANAVFNIYKHNYTKPLEVNDCEILNLSINNDTVQSLEVENSINHILSKYPKLVNLLNINVGNL